MLGIIKSKFRSKKAIHACLFLGIILLIAIFCSYPMYETGADNSIINSALVKFTEDNNLYPGAVMKKDFVEIGDQTNIKSADDFLTEVHRQIQNWESNINLPVLDKQVCIGADMRNGESHYQMQGKNSELRYIENLSDHIDIVEGLSLKEAKIKTGLDGKEYYPVIINVGAKNFYKVVVDEEITYIGKFNGYEYEIGYYVAGVFEKKSVNDPFWELDYATDRISLFTSKEVIEAAVFGNSISNAYYSLVELFDVRYLTRDKVKGVFKAIDQISAGDDAFKNNIRPALKYYEKDSSTITTLLNVLVFPTLALILFFIVLISNQIIKGEESEIAVLRSRGRSQFFVIRSYIIEGFVSVSLCYLPGLGLGYVLGKVMAHCDSFLHFIPADTSYYMFDSRMFIFGLVACLLAVICFTVPVIKLSKLTIVMQKAQNPYANKKAFWEKIFLDVILLGVSIYLLKTNLDKKEALAESVILAKPLDPVVFISYSVFMIACGLVFIRLVKYLIAIIDNIGKKKWKPAVYASFLQIRRTFRAQSVISIFVILTISSGVFYASLAGTISSNTKKRTVYESGADAVVRNVWKLSVATNDAGESMGYYTEPEVDVFDQMHNAGIIESYAKVIEEKNAHLYVDENIISTADFYAVNTKQFGETASLIDGRSNVEWYQALNELSVKHNGAIISKNFADRHDIKIGDSVNFEIQVNRKYGPSEVNGYVEVVAIIDAFPGYERYQYKVSGANEFSRDDTSLIVVNYAYAVEKGGIIPYDVWLKYGKKGSADAVRKVCEENNVGIVKEAYIDELNDQIKNNIINVITYGMFTMSFIMALIASGIGLILFWGMSVNDRSLVFGVFRAMGLKRKELNKMLLMEQIFTTGMAIVGGTFIGLLTAALFVKLVAVVYLPKTSVIPMLVTFDPANVVTIAIVVSAFMIICWYIMRHLIRKLKVVDAIKIGED